MIQKFNLTVIKNGTSEYMNFQNLDFFEIEELIKSFDVLKDVKELNFIIKYS